MVVADYESARSGILLLPAKSHSGEYPMKWHFEQDIHPKFRNLLDKSRPSMGCCRLQKAARIRYKLAVY
jgi:hypothetical protein